MVKKNIHFRKWHILSLLALVSVFAVAISAGAVFANAPLNNHVGKSAAAPTIPDRPADQNAFAFLQPSTDTNGSCPAPANGGTVLQGCTFALDMMLDAGTNIAPNGLTAQQSYLTFTNSLVNVTRKLVGDVSVTCVITGILPSDSAAQDRAVFDSQLQNEVCNSQPGGCIFRGVPVGNGAIAYSTGALSNCPNGCPDPGQPSPQDQPVFRVGRVPLCANGGTGQVRLHWQFSDPACSGAFPPAPITRAIAK